MAHGGLLRMMAQQPRGLDVRRPSPSLNRSTLALLGQLLTDLRQPWSNAEVRTFTFASMSPADEEASLVRIDPKT